MCAMMVFPCMLSRCMWVTVTERTTVNANQRTCDIVSDDEDAGGAGAADGVSVSLAKRCVQQSKRKCEVFCSYRYVDDA